MLGRRRSDECHEQHNGNGESQVQGVAQGNSNDSTKNKAFTFAAQGNGPQFPIQPNFQGAVGGLAIVATLIDFNVANGVVVKSAQGGDASNSALFDNYLNQSNDS